MKLLRALLVLASLSFALHPTPSAAQGMQKTSLKTAEAPSYRTGAARHIYATYAERIYKGVLPPLVHAVVVIETEVDRLGNVKDVHVIRGPSHAPDVTEAVKGMITGASPFPAPGAASAKFTEVWLVDHSGRFQLHALTEGQH